jgi:hypothetical protein
LGSTPTIPIKKKNYTSFATKHVNYKLEERYLHVILLYEANTLNGILDPLLQLLVVFSAVM